MNESDTHSALSGFQTRAENALNSRLPAASSEPTRLHEAIRYAVLGGGKRVRPLLVYAAGQSVGAPLNRLDGPACAVELIHAYSLIHDDLPAMDDDDLRRGRPTVHKAFDEATAILAGDALQALAFEILANDSSVRPDLAARLKMISILAKACGSEGMVGGQAIDLYSVGKGLTQQQLETMHRFKTGALIRASVLLGAISGDLDINDGSIVQLDQYAQHIGLAFQVKDDILDVEGDTEVIGKTQGSDEARNKPTFVSLLGLDGAKAMAKQLHKQALDALRSFDDTADSLRSIANYIINREK